jgi:hypothetical protein
VRPVDLGDLDVDLRLTGGRAAGVGGVAGEQSRVGRVVSGAEEVGDDQLDRRRRGGVDGELQPAAGEDGAGDNGVGVGPIAAGEAQAAGRLFAARPGRDGRRLARRLPEGRLACRLDRRLGGRWRRQLHRLGGGRESRCVDGCRPGAGGEALGDALIVLAATGGQQRAQQQGGRAERAAAG